VVLDDLCGGGRGGGGVQREERMRSQGEAGFQDSRRQKAG
jgi:hypothetical protein